MSKPSGVTWKNLHMCQEHKIDFRDRCWSCQVAINWNIDNRHCHCGAKAVGYRLLSKESDVEFFCDEHFEGVPVREEVEHER